MKIIVGLGNPGNEYINTRHNIGFLIVERLKTEISNVKSLSSNQIQNSNFKYQNKYNAEICQIGDVLLVKPQTFMNKSGEAVSKIVNFYKVALDDLWVIHDDLDIRMGDFKVMKGKGPKIHNGINSIETSLGSKEFWRIRIGVDNRHQEVLDSNNQNKITPLNPLFRKEGEQERKISGSDYVLMKLKEEEKRVLDGVIEDVCRELMERLR